MASNMGIIYLSVIVGVVIGALVARIVSRSGKRWLPVFLITAIVAAVVVFLIWGRILQRPRRHDSIGKTASLAKAATSGSSLNGARFIALCSRIGLARDPALRNPFPCVSMAAITVWSPLSCGRTGLGCRRIVTGSQPSISCGSVRTRYSIRGKLGNTGLVDYITPGNQEKPSQQTSTEWRDFVPHERVLTDPVEELPGLREHCFAPPLASPVGRKMSTS
jgi:MFS family permease